MLPLVLVAAALAGPLPSDWTCRTVGAMAGPEDVDRLADGTLLASADARWEHEEKVGGLHRVDLATDTSTPIPLVGRDACPFHPHGVAVQGDRIWVILHYGEERPAGCALPAEVHHGIERFTVGAEATFEDRIVDPLLRNPNDLAVDAAGDLWVSDNPEWRGSGLALDVLFDRRRSRLLRFSNGVGEVALDRVLYANGVLARDDGSLLLTSYRGRVLSVRDGGATLVVRLRGALDNIMANDDGSLMIAGHPKPFAFLRHVRDPDAISPSETFVLRPDGEGWTVESWVEDTGLNSAGSTALMFGDQLVFGRVFQSGVVACTR